MADLHFVDFALTPSPVRKEKQSRLPDDFSEFDFTIFSHGGAIPRSVFPRFFEFSNRPLFGDPQTVLHDEGVARNFDISTLRGRNRRLLAAVM